MAKLRENEGYFKSKPRGLANRKQEYHPEEGSAIEHAPNG
jgi:hypothetical protein